MTNDEACKAVIGAVQAGYRLFDTAHGYENEAGVGQGIRSCGVPREELFVTSKLLGAWHGYTAAQSAYQASLHRMGLEYLDLYLIHWPLPSQDRYVDAWRGLSRLLEDGRVRAIGTSNFKPAHLQRLIAETGVAPDVNQIELNPYLHRRETRAHGERLGVATQAWAPIGQGGALLHDASVTATAANHNKSAAQIILRWHLQHGVVPIPKSSDRRRIRENIDIFDFELTSEEVARLAELDRGEQAAVDSDTTGC
jgi:2,5-diketo-D-gluconate reductase A